MPQSFASLHYHIVFSTKNREHFLDCALQPRLYEYVGGTLRQHNGVLLAAGGMPDHIHLLVGLHREMSVADAVKLVKANSSKWIHESFPDRAAFAWQTGYGAFTVSYSNMEQVKRYIGGQEEHHRTRTFKEEFIAFLRRHNIEYDERYLWD
jgi:REP element-mobilizing transposase RayT